MQKRGCKSAPSQYKCGYYLTPPQSLSKKQIKTKLIFCKPLFIVLGRVKGFLKGTKMKHLTCQNGSGMCIIRLYKC